MLKTTVKVGEISNLSDARYCAGMGVEMLGFLLDTEEAITIADVKEITSWIEGCKYVAEFKTSSLEQIEKAMQDFSFDYIQIQDKTLVPALQEKGLNIILQCNANEVESTLAVDYLLLKEPLSELPTTDSPILYGGDMDNQSLEQIVETVAGINLLGSEEIRPGYKDFDELADILESIELED